jgi:hypothetical protein
MYLVTYRDLTADDGQSTHVNTVSDSSIDHWFHYDAGGIIHLLDWRWLHDEDGIFKLIVAGGRDFNDYVYLKQRLDHYLAHCRNIVIVLGTARGADLLGERYAKERGYPVDQYPADWTLGALAGPIRNEKMASQSGAVACVCFHDGKSRGTANMIKNAQKHNLNLRIEPY